METSEIAAALKNSNTPVRTWKDFRQNSLAALSNAGIMKGTAQYNLVEEYMTLSEQIDDELLTEEDDNDFVMAIKGMAESSGGRKKEERQSVKTKRKTKRKMKRKSKRRWKNVKRSVRRSEDAREEEDE